MNIAMWKSLHKELAHHCTLNNQFLSRKLNVGWYSEKVTFVKYGNVYQGDELYDEKLIIKFQQGILPITIYQHSH